MTRPSRLAKAERPGGDRRGIIHRKTGGGIGSIRLMCADLQTDDIRLILKGITLLGGNLSDEVLTTRTGPNDACLRGEMYVEARRLANEALALLDEQRKAPL